MKLRTPGGAGAWRSTVTELAVAVVGASTFHNPIGSIGMALFIDVGDAAAWSAIAKQLPRPALGRL